MRATLGEPLFYRIPDTRLLDLPLDTCSLTLVLGREDCQFTPESGNARETVEYMGVPLRSTRADQACAHLSPQSQKVLTQREVQYIQRMNE